MRNKELTAEDVLLRFKFFEQQLGFVTALTDICERLRFERITINISHRQVSFTALY